MEPNKLADAICEVFLNSDQYLFDKHVPAFKVDDKFLGDFFNIIIVEPRGAEPPIFYHTFSPYDVISNKAPDRAVIFQNGELLLSTDFADYVSQRTGIMSPLLLQALGIQSMSDKQVLFVGTGVIARRALMALKALYPNTKTISFVNKSGNAHAFVELATELQIAATPATLKDISKFDYIFCHSSSKEPIITAGHKNQIKQGAVITVFASEDHIEVAEELYGADATVIVDWEQTINEAIELKAAVDHNLKPKGEVVMLKEVLEKGTSALSAAKYTIFRSHGTPLQNLAVLKLLLQTVR